MKVIEYKGLYDSRIVLRPQKAGEKKVLDLGACRMNLVEKVFGTHSERELKLIYPIIDKIEKLRPEMQKMSDEELKDQTRKFKERLAAGGPYRRDEDR